MRAEIEDCIRRSEGELAADRLLDLMQRFVSGQRDLVRAGVLLSAEVRAWRKDYRRSPKADRQVREEWVRLLERILELTDTTVEASASQSGRSSRADTLSNSKTTLPDMTLEAGFNSSPTISVESICKRYTSKGRFELRNISFDLPPSQIAGVIGPNGSGKSTLLRILAGEVQADYGRIRFPRFNNGGSKSADWSLIKRHIGYVAQRPEPWIGRLGENLYTWAARSGIYGQSNQVCRVTLST